MSRGQFKRMQSSPMLTVVPETDFSYYDNRLLASRQYSAAYRKRREYKKQRVPFVPNPKWKRCYAGADRKVVREWH